MYIDLGFDKDECDNKFDDYESNSDRNRKEKNSLQRPNKLDASHYVLQETISSLKMKSKFQISKKEFFSKIGKDKPVINSSQTRSLNAASSSDKSVSHQYSTSKSVSNTNSAYGSLRINDSTRTGSESGAAKKNLDASKKSSQMNSLNNTELIVQSYGFHHNQQEQQKFVVDKKMFDERPLVENGGEETEGAGTVCFFIATGFGNFETSNVNCLLISFFIEYPEFAYSALLVFSIFSRQSSVIVNRNPCFLSLKSANRILGLLLISVAENEDCSKKDLLLRGRELYQNQKLQKKIKTAFKRVFHHHHFIILIEAEDFQLFFRL